MTEDASKPNPVEQTTPKPKRRYEKTGFYARNLTPEERAMAEDVLEGLYEDCPDLAESFAWRIQAQHLARAIILSDRCMTPADNHENRENKVGVSRDKLVILLMDQLGLSRKPQIAQNSKADEMAAFMAKIGANDKSDGRKRRSTNADNDLGVSR